MASAALPESHASTLAASIQSFNVSQVTSATTNPSAIGTTVSAIVEVDHMAQDNEDVAMIDANDAVPEQITAVELASSSNLLESPTTLHDASDTLDADQPAPSALESATAENFEDATAEIALISQDGLEQLHESSVAATEPSILSEEFPDYKSPKLPMLDEFESNDKDPMFVEPLLLTERSSDQATLEAQVIPRHNCSDVDADVTDTNSRAAEEKHPDLAHDSNVTLVELLFRYEEMKSRFCLQYLCDDLDADAEESVCIVLNITSAQNSKQKLEVDWLPPRGHW